MKNLKKKIKFKISYIIFIYLFIFILNKNFKKIKVDNKLKILNYCNLNINNIEIIEI